eukprot:COSAG02_NODE_415_length_22762_cov_133.681816_28_plen_38_part_01
MIIICHCIGKYNATQAGPRPTKVRPDKESARATKDNTY